MHKIRRAGIEYAYKMYLCKVKQYMNLPSISIFYLYPSHFPNIGRWGEQPPPTPIQDRDYLHRLPTLTKKLNTSRAYLFYKNIKCIVGP